MMNTESDLLITRYQIEMISPACTPGASWWSVRISLTDNISEVFPYLNAELRDTNYNHNTRVLLWDSDDGFRYAFRSNEIAIAPIEDRNVAQKLCEDVINLICDVWQKRHRITPDFKGKAPSPGILEILKLLPGTNCKVCGHSTCMAFAAALIQKQIEFTQCASLFGQEYSDNRKALSALFEYEPK